MSLKVELKPGERLIVGNVLITNSEQRARLYIEGNAPILREKDILSPSTADSPARRIYLAVQLMYLDGITPALRADYMSLLSDLAAAAPSTIPLLDQLNNDVLTNALYKGLKTAKKLIALEQDILHAAASGAGLSADGQADSDSSRS